MKGFIVGFLVATLLGAGIVGGLLTPKIKQIQAERQYRIEQTANEHKAELEWSEARYLTCSDLFRSHTRLSEAMDTVGAVPYANPGNNCYDSSQSLVAELTRQGILSFIAVTEDRNDNGLGDHAYVLVAIEPATGEFAPAGRYIMSDYIPIREIRDKNLRIVCD